MSGHSKWANIKHTKAKKDAERGNLFSKLAREIIVAARQGGGNPEANSRLRLAIERAREANMPAENIARLIKRGTGELEGVTYEELTYEGYGPGGVAIMVEAVTDNRNRTTGELRYIFSRHGGSLGETGCVNWMFRRRGYISLDRRAGDEDTVLGVALEAGAEDFQSDEESYEVITAPEDLERVKAALEEKGLRAEVAEVTMIPQSTVRVAGKEAEQVLRLMDALSDHDDVQRVFSNFDMAADEMRRLAG
ncbi:MAG: YebC/PmpR family DNA-binding transcriptional regulator [Bacillota bacterium]|nr:YebC/PmpR family DNA-binding transcriptional regulator [Bacillota bacterium]MDI7248894.1 YebC/PmpR family DNA-binding transcriptional regulator [Bacillota bacterium]